MAEQTKDVRLLYRLLKQVDFFSDLSMSELELLIEGIVLEKYPPGKMITEEGYAGNSLYLIAKGRVSVWMGNKTKLVAFLDAGKFFGEMALMDDQIRKATVVTDEKCEFYTLYRGRFWETLMNNPQIKEKIQQTFEKRKLDSQKKTDKKSDVISISPGWRSYRYKKFLQRFF